MWMTKMNRKSWNKTPLGLIWQKENREKNVLFFNLQWSQITVKYYHLDHFKKEKISQNGLQFHSWF